MLPGIEIEFKNGALGQVVPSPDGCMGLVTMADEVSTTFLHETPYVVKSMVDVVALGIIDSVGNHRIYKFLSEFFEEGGSGQELWVMAFAKSDSEEAPVKMSDLFTIGSNGKTPAEQLLDASNGKVRGVFAVWNPSEDYTPVITAGMDADVVLTKSKGQILLERYTSTKYAPAFLILEAYGFSGVHTALPDLTEESNNRVGIMIGDTESRTGSTTSMGSALGCLAGRLAKYQVQVNAGRVANGALKPLKFFVEDDLAESYDVESLHDKGYISIRSHVGRSGYFFTDDPLATSVSDDYHAITHRRAIDKAYRIAYDALLDFLLDDLQLTNSGTIAEINAKTIESKVVNAIYSQMTVNGELSADLTDSKDKGVLCKIDLTENVASSSKLKLAYLQVRPKGHARYIIVPLGFVPVTV
jgi:hypothetical protein